MRLFFLILCFISNVIFADVTVSIYDTTQSNHESKQIGTIIFKNTVYGLLIIPDLHGLLPGLHGFHLHDQPNCTHHAMSAGGHYDPQKTGKHLGPFARGHLGDLPALYVNAQGDATQPILAPRLREKDLYGHAVILHEGADNYADTPKPLGGGGDRIACGVIKNFH